jgi:peptidoglycan hydrolase-like protein with peptidoglycan-binding domain
MPAITPALRPTVAALPPAERLQAQVAAGQNLRQGARGDAVREAQQLLTAHGHPLTADGAFGPRTHDAVVAFQRSRGLQADGVIGPATMRELRTPTAGVDRRTGPTSGLSPTPGDRVPGMSGADFQRQAELDAARRQRAPATPAPGLPAPGVYETRGGAIAVRPAETAEALRQRSPEHARLVDEMRAQGFHPVRTADGSTIFMSNPSYAPDTNGRGVSSNEARRYAEARGLRLPTRAEADAFRAQAGVVVQFEAGPTPGTPAARSATEQQARIAARLREAGIPEDGVAIAGATKIWAQEPGQRPGLNGAVTNVRSGSALQSYSTVHGPDYEDYSQAAQFVHSVRVARDGTIVR